MCASLCLYLVRNSMFEYIELRIHGEPVSSRFKAMHLRLMNDNNTNVEHDLTRNNTLCWRDYLHAVWHSYRCRIQKSCLTPNQSTVRRSEHWSHHLQNKIYGFHSPSYDTPGWMKHICISRLSINLRKMPFCRWSKIQNEKHCIRFHVAFLELTWYTLLFHWFQLPPLMTRTNLTYFRVGWNV